MLTTNMTEFKANQYIIMVSQYAVSISLVLKINNAQYGIMDLKNVLVIFSPSRPLTTCWQYCHINLYHIHVGDKPNWKISTP